jgi:transposase
MESPDIEKQIQELDEWMKSDLDSRELKRALGVKLALKGWAYRVIAEALNVSTSYVSKWKKRFQEAGVEGLRLSYQGAKSYLTSQQKPEVITWLKEQEAWDLSELECHLIEKYDVVFQSLTSYYELLKEARVSWQKAQKSNPRHDPELVKKKAEEIQSILGALMPDINTEKVAVYAIDEVHLLEGDLISHLWGDSKNRLSIPIINEKNRQTYYGALNLMTKELILGEYQKGNGESTVDFLRKLIQKNPYQKILIFWDGAAYHKGELMREFLRELNADLSQKDWTVTCHLFAPYAPEENPIEAVWLQLKSLLRRCHRFCKNFSIIKRLFQLFVNLKLFNFPNLEKYNNFSCLI